MRWYPNVRVFKNKKIPIHPCMHRSCRYLKSSRPPLVYTDFSVFLLTKEFLKVCFCERIKNYLQYCLIFLSKIAGIFTCLDLFACSALMFPLVCLLFGSRVHRPYLESSKSPTEPLAAAETKFEMFIHASNYCSFLFKNLFSILLAAAHLFLKSYLN